MSTVYVKPSPGGRVRMPDRDFRPMPEEGAHVPRNDYYERLIIGGDLEITDPPVEATAAPAALAVIVPPVNKI